MREVYDLVLGPVDHEDGRGHLGHLVNAGRKGNSVETFAEKEVIRWRECPRTVSKVILPGKGVEEPRPLGLREGDPHARHQGRVQHDGAHLEAGGKVDRGHRPDALAVQDDVLCNKKKKACVIELAQTRLKQMRDVNCPSQ